MSNSSLVTVTVPSPNKSSRCGHSIDTITIHCTDGQCTADTMGKLFSSKERKASSNYGIGEDGSVGLYVDESERSWCSTSMSNDARAVTIEVSSENGPDFAVGSTAYGKLIELVTDVCRRNGIKKLIWCTDRDGRVSHDNGANMTCHCDFDSSKACPGKFLYSRMPEIAKMVNTNIGAQGPYIVRGDEAPSISGQDNDNATPNECEDDPDVINPGDNASDNDKNVALAIVKAAVGFDDDLGDIVEGKLMGLITGIDDTETLENLEDADAETIAKVAQSVDVGKIIEQSQKIIESITKILPGPFASAFGCKKLVNGEHKLSGLSESLSKRALVNKQYASAYPNQKASQAFDASNLNRIMENLEMADNDNHTGENNANSEA